MSPRLSCKRYWTCAIVADPSVLRTGPRCHTFLGARVLKTIPGSRPVRYLCHSQCRAWVCSDCGVEQGYAKHICTATTEDKDPFSGLTLGKDLQSCPTGSCRRPYFLADGCNGVRCVSCKVNFCFVCAVPNPDRTHWNRGGCPKFNQPGAENALYGEDVQEIGHALHAGPRQVEERLSNQQRLALRARHEELLSQFQNRFALPPLPPLDGLTNLQKLQLEQSLALENTAPGRIMIRHRSALQDLQGEVARAHAGLVQRGEVISGWLGALPDVLVSLLTNIDIYVFRVRTAVSRADYARRHDSIQNFWEEHRGAPLTQRYPKFVEIVLFYLQVANLRSPEIAQL